MFIILLTYKKPLAEIDQYLVEHRQFLAAGYEQNFFVASGPQNPRTGGVVISQLKDRGQLEQILKLDPFCLHDLAEYEIIEFTPVKYHADFAVFMS